ncbi:MAG: DUF2218 domain-containing protein [Silicimonas sp.]|nr:DUF2218 domain-containing protein [Silicimonas sp.]
MPILTGRVETEHGAKYLAQLCKHFAHKIEASHDGTTGRAEFVYGPAIMSADDRGLTIRFELGDPDHIAGAKDVIDSHLERFAFREAITGMDWREE